MVDADSRLIEWLFNESGITRYKISKEVGISESTLSRIVSGETPMDAVRFGYARKLTEYARSIKAARGNEGQGDDEPASHESSKERKGGEES